MIKCPRCQNSVDEKLRASCPVCLMPLAGPPASNGAAVPGAVPPPGSGYMPPPPSPRIPSFSPPPMPSAQPPGSPGSVPASAYAPPPGSPYAAPPAAPAIPTVPGALPVPSIGMPPPIPGYGSPANTRTTLTGEVVETNVPAQNYASPYPPSGYTPPPAPTPYGSGYPAAAGAYPLRPAAPPKTGWTAANWKLAGGGSITALYIAARLLFIFARNMYPASPAPAPLPSYSSAERQSFSSSPVPASPPYRYTAPRMPQQPVYSPMSMPPHPNFPSRFQPPNMPNMPGSPRSFSGPNAFPGPGPPLKGRSVFGKTPEGAWVRRK